MKMYKTLAIWLILPFWSFLGFGQNEDPRKANYTFADSVALNFSTFNSTNYKKLARKLTKDTKTEHEKFRVLFRWITNNIEYGYSNRTDDPKIALKTKKAVCEGYAVLLEKMCKSVNIECIVIKGYTKQLESGIGKRLTKIDHAWNAVKLHGSWYLVDITWATSYDDVQNRRFVKRFDSKYFLSNPEYFVVKHLPEKLEWQLLEKKVTKEQFINSPYILDSFDELQIEDFTPREGIIQINSSDSLRICLTTNREKLLWPTFQLQGVKEEYYPKIEKNENIICLKQKFDKTGTFYLELFAYQRLVMIYKIIIKP